MPKFEVVPAMPYHVGAILRKMRHEHREAVIALGVEPHRELKNTFDRSAFCKAWMIDGKLSALGGLIGTMTSGSGHLWLVIAEDAQRYAKEIVREARNQIKGLLVTHYELTTSLLADDKTAMRFAKFLGFKRRGIQTGGIIEATLKRDPPPAIVPLSIGNNDVPPFIIYGLPRSRTAWLSQFLSFDGWVCHHDSMMEADGFNGIRAILATPKSGICETGFVAGAPLLRKCFRTANIVVVKRPVDDVRKSLMKFGWEFAPDHLEWMDRELDKISAWPGVLTVNFEDLSDQSVCETLFEHCLGQPLGVDWFHQWKNRIVEIDMKARMMRLIYRGPEMGRLVAECKELLSPVTYQTEPWESFMADAKSLFDEHYAEVGSIDGLPFDPNYEIGERLDHLNSLQIMTVRAGSKMIGYMLFIIEPSLESSDVMCAAQNATFVMKGFRGPIGRRLYDESFRALRRRGVDRLILRAGSRGAGPKQAELFKRLGAKEDARLFSLNLGESIWA